jgi:hypothetical protein
MILGRIRHRFPSVKKPDPSVNQFYHSRSSILLVKIISGLSMKQSPMNNNNNNPQVEEKKAGAGHRRLPFFCFLHFFLFD